MVQLFQTEKLSLNKSSLEIGHDSLEVLHLKPHVYFYSKRESMRGRGYLLS